MQVWRKRADGSGEEQVTSDDFNNWYPHISPDGRRIVFLSVPKSVTGRPKNVDVTLRMMVVGSRQVSFLANFPGGQGSMDAPPWSPDSRNVAFVSYQLLPPEAGRRR